MAPEDSERFDYCYRQASGVNEKLQKQHDEELAEMRSFRSSQGGLAEYKVGSNSFDRSAAREPLYEAFRRQGFARGTPAEIPWAEFRSLTWRGSVDTLNSPRRDAGMLGYDQRYAYQALPSVGVGA